ncbi:biotin synthase BioB [Ketobacter sp. MCCC 1A13808]|uniref:biotin synthase BioB n=1 Tax=Ketobacter sp. MCCC 1A13808 TaxID=2602738 RepID=UPI000F2B2940|nr:biotin synthase BioB [Ketobacter sp. MCCC 1A13808]MVF14615.1 biotin synthase BioB [Ketobacter sp. MCCC 1A13808]RLP52611.1 MAG: biotin synthase BioB [Ketobacter sp.]
MTAKQNPVESIRHDWTIKEIQQLFDLPFNDLMFQAQTVHRQYHDPNAVQISTLLSIKTGACPEDCKYCSQSGHYNTGLEKEKLLEINRVLEQARQAKASGASRFCMGAAWRSPREKDMPYVLDMVQQVKSLGMETCMTLGMLDQGQAQRLADAGLDYYNHNLDTSPEHYNSIITTRTYQDRLDTLSNVRDAGMKVCCGGILGLGETARDRAGLLMQLANLPDHPESVPINMLVKIEGTPLADVADLEPFDFVRNIAVARILMPKSFVRLSAGREAMNEQMQSLCFMAGANSIFYGDRLLTTSNPEANSDQKLFAKLGIKPLQIQGASDEANEAAILDSVEHQKNAHLFVDATRKSATPKPHEQCPKMAATGGALQ